MIRQSENSVGKAYTKLMDKLSDHITLLARNGKPITSIMGIKRVMYRYRRQLTPLPAASPQRGEQTPPSAELTPPQMGRTVSALNEDVRLLVGDVLDKLDVDVLEAVEVGLVGEKELKRVLIKHDYEKLAKQGLKMIDVKKRLSEKYEWSVSRIEKLVYAPP